MKTNRKYLVLAGSIAAVLVPALLLTELFWDRIAIASAPARKAAVTRSAAALEADKQFWATFHGGRYADIQPTVDTLTAAYLETPNDTVTAAHVGWLHIWRLAERARAPGAPATITDDIVLAHKYFDVALTLEPSEARYRGFLAATLLSEGNIDRDEKLTRRGFFMMREAVAEWPEFNLFTAGYVVSGQPASSKQFADGLEQQWKNMDVCAKTKIDRANPDFGRYIPSETKTGHERACWNSWIAPHNLEGFFLNMGDMLVKKGDWRLARAIYRNATQPSEYPTWKYQGVLAGRIANAEANVAEFNKASPSTRIMQDSAFACMGCHEE